MNDLPDRLRSVTRLLRSIAEDYEDMKTTHSEEALLQPLSILVNEDGEAEIWCAKEDCLLDCENSKIDIDVDSFNARDLLTVVAWHIGRNEERKRALNDL